MDWTIEIEGLFELFNVRIDMGKKLNIIIGENGIGKSTILNIVYFFIKRDFINLSKYPFVKLKISIENDIIEILFEDLFPSIKVINEKLEILFSEYKDNFEDEYTFFLNNVNDLEKRNRFYYAYYLSRCFHRLPIGSNLKLQMHESCYLEMTPTHNPLDQMYAVMQSINIINETESYFRGSNIKQMMDRIISLNISENAILMDMSIKNQFIDNNLSEPYYFSPDLKWILSNSVRAFSTLNSEFHQILRKMHINLAFDNDFETYTNRDLLMSLDFQKPIDVNDLVNRLYFSKDFIRKINMIAAKESAKYIGESKVQLANLDRTFFTEEVIWNTENYLVPLVMKDTLLGQFIREYVDCERMGFKHNEYESFFISAFTEFYTQNIELIMNSAEPKIKLLEQIINDFSSNKTYHIFPSGIKIYVIKEKISKKGIMNLITTNINQIKSSELSSGEKKLLLMLIIGLFYDDGLLMIDEPEISLSILWQEKLFPQILKHIEFQSILVATHSPFIASDEVIRNALIMLPMEV